MDDRILCCLFEPLVKQPAQLGKLNHWLILEREINLQTTQQDHWYRVAFGNFSSTLNDRIFTLFPKLFNEIVVQLFRRLYIDGNWVLMHVSLISFFEINTLKLQLTNSVMSVGKPHFNCVVFFWNFAFMWWFLCYFLLLWYFLLF